MLYPAPLRDLLIRLACTGLVRARWTKDIQDEWIRNLLRTRTDLNLEQLQRTARLMETAVPDCLVSGYRELISGLQLPDPDDRHVLAAAIASSAGVIVTYNLSDFPAEALQNFGIEAQHPDEFLHHLIYLSPSEVCKVIRQQRAAIKNPPLALDDFLSCLRAANLSVTVAALESMRSDLIEPS